ncbi:MAG: GNAT family N-acetyltransferase [Geitlerinemataceae cyanobacterium]
MTEQLETLPEVSIRSAQPEDVSVLFDLILALAKYEKLSDAVTGDAAALNDHLFGERSYAEALLAEWEGKSIGFALFFHNYSTFLTQPGIYLEDLFVLPDYRGQGIGKGLIRQLARIAVDRGCGRLEWTVLDWNESAIGFYQHLGAAVLPDWRVCRVTGESLTDLAKDDRCG